MFSQKLIDQVIISDEEMIKKLPGSKLIYVSEGEHSLMFIQSNGEVIATKWDQIVDLICKK